MPNTVTKETADKFTHMSDQEPERDGLDYGPDDDYMEIVTSVPADVAEGTSGDDTLEESFSSQGKSADDSMDMGGENYSQDIVQRTPEPEPEPDPEADKGAKPATEGEEKTSEDKPAKDKSAAQKRIDQIIKQRNEAREQAAYYRGLSENTPAADPEAAPPPTEKPKLADFEDYEQFSEAMADYKLAERDRINATSAEQKVADTTGELIKTQIDAGKAKYDDFQAKVLDNESLAFHEPVIEAITELENAADVMYELAKDPVNLANIARMSPVSMARELVKIDSRFAGGAETTKPPKTISSAPAPITPVNTGGSEITRKEPADMTMDEYISWRTRGGKRKV